MSRTSNNLILLLIIFAVVLAGIALFLGGSFFNNRNIVSMGFQVPEFGFIALAMALAMLTGGIDLSVIATMNLSGILAAYVLTNKGLLASIGTGPVVAIAIAVSLVCGLACGIVNGFTISRLGVPAILATLATMLLYSGIGMAITGGQGVVGFPDAFMVIGNARVLGIPLPLIVMLIGFLVVIFLVNSTAWGKSLYLLGENRIAALFSGIRSAKTLIVTYAVCGLFSSISAVILISRVNSARIGYGDTYLLQAILVVVMGGINPQGGSGKILGVLIGILILQSLSSSFTLFAISPYARGLIYGSMLLIVMIANQVYAERRFKSQLKRMSA